MMMLSSFYLLCFAIIFGSLLWRFPAMGCVAHDAQMLLSFKHDVLIQNGFGFLGEDVPGFLSNAALFQTRRIAVSRGTVWYVLCNPSTSHVQHLHLNDSLGSFNVSSDVWDPLNVSAAALHPLSQLPGLTYLDISNNNLEPSALHPLSQLLGLTYLDLSYNNLEPSAVLSSLSKFPAISHIILQGDGPEGTGVGSISLDEWSQESLKRMRYLDLADNGITGRLPPQLSNMSNLFHLDLGGNLFTFAFQVIEMSLPSMTSLQYLDLSQMNLSMSTPHFWQNTVANLSRLSSLRLRKCSLTESNAGRRMNWLGKLHNLEDLSLGGNSIRATFPLVLNNLTKLTFLDVSENMLMGSGGPRNFGEWGQHGIVLL